MTAIIYIARHGETEWNRQGRMQGQKDSPLTALGREQAMTLRQNLLADERIAATGGISVAYSSALGRARETLEICLKDMDIHRDSSAGLNEICLGPWEGLTFEEVKQRWPEQFHNFWHGPSRYVPEGNGETFEQVQNRMVSSIKRIMDRHRSGNILVISHWIAIKTALAYFKGLQIDAIPNMPKPANGEYQIIGKESRGTPF
jgi:probable phosphoglycerate mutase